jgi:hypothetical protein
MRIFLKGKDPGEEGPALFNPVGVIWIIAYTISVQASELEFY